jgi:uncharacterized protein (TIGR02001 family)
MIKSRIAVVGVLLAVTGTASATGFTVTPTIATDYDFRGVSQTIVGGDRDELLPFEPAFQLGANYAAENGLYAGIWGSNVDFGPGNPSIELDYTAGFAGGDAAESFGYDLGATYYTYLDASSRSTVEVYAGISRGCFSGKIWYSPDYASSDDSGFYVEGNATIPLPMEFNLLGHVGISGGDFYGSSITDYSIGVARTIGGLAANLKFVDGTDRYDGRFVLAVSTTLPWGE